MTDNKEPWKGKKDELLLVNAAVDRELDDYTKRDAAMQERATILIGAASVVGAIQLGDGFSFWTVANLILSFVAAALGVVVIFPRTGMGFSPRTMWDKFYEGMGDEEVLHNAVRVKIATLEEDDKWLGRRAWFARVGFILLAVSILAAALAVISPAAGWEPDPSASPSATADVPAD